MKYISRIVLYTILQLAPMITFAGKLFSSDSKWSERPGWWTVWFPFLLDIAKSIASFLSSALHFIIIYGWPAVLLFCVVWGTYIYNRDMGDPNKKD